MGCGGWGGSNHLTFQSWESTGSWRVSGPSYFQMPPPTKRQLLLTRSTGLSSGKCMRDVWWYQGKQKDLVSVEDGTDPVPGVSLGLILVENTGSDIVEGIWSNPLSNLCWDIGASTVWGDIGLYEKRSGIVQSLALLQYDRGLQDISRPRYLRTYWCCLWVTVKSLEMWLNLIITLLVPWWTYACPFLWTCMHSLSQRGIIVPFQGEK